MADPKKGFDPLASLFDGPDLRDFSGEGSPLPEIDDSMDFTDPSPESTDPLISMPVDGMSVETLKGSDPGSTPSPVPIPPRARVEMPSAVDVPEPSSLPPVDSPTEEGPTGDEKAQLAKALAAAALAKAQAARAEAAAALEVEPEAPKVETPKSEGLAKAEAKRRKSIPPPPEEEPAPAPTSRLSGLAARAPKPRSALEAARAAAQAEAAKREAADVAKLLELPAKVDVILRRQLKGIRSLDVVNALIMDDRPLLQALWKGHRARFAAIGSLSEVVATTNVIRALGAVPKKQLVAAIVETDQTDYLVWVDLGSEAVIAAFPDARAWYATARKP